MMKKALSSRTNTSADTSTLPSGDRTNYASGSGSGYVQSHPRKPAPSVSSEALAAITEAKEHLQRASSRYRIRQS